MEKGNNWRSIAERQSAIIEELSAAYRDILLLLSQYQTVEAEEEKLKNILEEKKHERT